MSEPGWVVVLLSLFLFHLSASKQERGIVDFHTIVSSKAPFKSVGKKHLLTCLGFG